MSDYCHCLRPEVDTTTGCCSQCHLAFDEEHWRQDRRVVASTIQATKRMVERDMLVDAIMSGTRGSASLPSK